MYQGKTSKYPSRYPHWKTSKTNKNQYHCQACQRQYKKQLLKMLFVKLMPTVYYPSVIQSCIEQMIQCVYRPHCHGQGNKPPNWEFCIKQSCCKQGTTKGACNNMQAQIFDQLDKFLPQNLSNKAFKFRRLLFISY